MFNSMRNQLKEKTGKELPKFTPQKGNLTRSSRQGSESSLGSLVLDSATQQPTQNSASASPTFDLHQIKLPDGKVLSPKEVSLISKKEDEWRNRLEKKDTEWTKKFDKKETELLKELSEKEMDWRTKERNLTEDLLKQTNELKEALRLAEEYKMKLIQYQEDKDQVESFQTQEMAKIKHLLLAKERENDELSESLKENSLLVETLKNEVSRLRPLEQQITNMEDEVETLRHTSEKERQSLARKLTESEEEVRHLSDRVALLTKRSSETDLALDSTPDNRIQALLGERALLERRLEEAHIHLTDIKASWSAQISSLETQVGRLSRQAGEEGVERRRALEKVEELESKLETELAERKKLQETLSAVSSLSQALQHQVDQLTEQNVSLKEGKEKIQTEGLRLEEVLKGSQEKVLKLQSDNESCEDKIKELENEIYSGRGREGELMKQLHRVRLDQEELVLRNAQLSQDADMATKEVLELRLELDAALSKSSILDSELNQTQLELQKCKKENEDVNILVSQLQSEGEAKRLNEDKLKSLVNTVADLELQLADRNKNIRLLQQNLNDMKKTLQRELKQNTTIGGEGDSNHVASSPAVLAHSTHTPAQLQTISTSLVDDINFQYLKHVIVKFLTSREYEAQQLTKAVATLLQLSPEEELLIRDTLDWKMSWFGSRPKLQDYS